MEIRLGYILILSISNKNQSFLTLQTWSNGKKTDQLHEKPESHVAIIHLWKIKQQIACNLETTNFLSIFAVFDQSHRFTVSCVELR